MNPRRPVPAESGPGEDIAELVAAEPAPPPAVAAEAPFALEFAVPPELAGRLARHPVIAGRRTGKARAHAEDLVWLDTAAGTLAGAGLALEAPRRGARRLLRILPEDGPWRPGTPPAVVQLLPAGAAPDEAAGEPMMPVAAFTGRRTEWQLALDTGPVQAVLLHGRLRSVAAEQEAARLILAGPSAAVLDLARALVEAFRLVPPRAALAEEGSALAFGTTVRARRRGPPELAGAVTVEAALAAALGHLVEAVLYQLPLARQEAGPEGVHQMRVALRRLRSVLKVARPAADGDALRGLDDRARALLQALGPARDWDVFLLGIGADIAAAMPEEKRIAALLRAAGAERRKAYEALAAALAGPLLPGLALETVALLATQGWRAEASEEAQALLATPPEEFAAPLLDKRLRRLLREGEEREALSAEALHELRLDGKRLRYAAELFSGLWQGKAPKRFLKRLSALQEVLGASNDAEVARGLVRGLATRDSGRAWALGVVEGWAALQASLRRQALEETWRDFERRDPFWSQQ